MTHCAIVHDIPGRMRLRFASAEAFSAEAPAVAAAAAALSGVAEVIASARTSGLLVLYDGAPARLALQAMARNGNSAKAARAVPRSRKPALVARAATSAKKTAQTALATAKRHARAAGDRLGAPAEAPVTTPMQSMARETGMFLLRSILPPAFRPLFLLKRVLPFIKRGAAALLRGKINVEVLDALAIGVSIARRDYRAATGIAILLGLGEVLESYTRKRSRDSLAETLAATFDTVWVRREGGPVHIPASEVVPGDLAIVTMGNAIPVDGVVAEGEGLVNQASMTGEPLPAHKRVGHTVFAGTVVEEGEIVVRVEKSGGETRIQKMVAVIEESENYKAKAQDLAERFADAVVPWTLLGALGVFLVTRNPRLASAVLLVDFSCAIKLSAPLAVLAAMREAATGGVLVKGGKFLEGVSSADAFVFDKTGTLTQARPKVAAVEPLNGYTRYDVLKLAACLEEHFPHPVARAVVRQAETEGVEHQEFHADVDYILAHGLSSMVGTDRVRLGSRHFIGEDEGLDIAEADAAIEARGLGGLSTLYLAIGDAVAGVLAIEDPLVPEAKHVLRELTARGVTRLVMLTGDAAAPAAIAARELGITDYHAQVLPEDKTRIVRELRDAGHVVAMVGDGINDSPALSAANVGIAPRHGADIAQAAADILLAEGSLESVVALRDIASGLMGRLRSNFRTICIINSVILGLGLFGRVTPGVSALAHNLATVGVALASLRPYLPKQLPRGGVAHDSQLH
ncbi:Lead, cadmium, zinc and mercury transporting ATPase [Desulfovibrio sp. DV]|uniref:heavy metal translocating P-type ATPase n=1 Tax=Desulfovibrio sp. DV TaxID=1844708 RepID=UPI00094B8F63|nr:heavy metal translocating P-type ATPase [Desulfovibrio sp. DV]OLN30267.1 Lead, cadmium, zinc and mercury transporting ATPase [Desulfovibrio sp. DV]